MKLCPYPFSRLQTGSYEDTPRELKKGFYPCCSSWFSKEYLDIEMEDYVEDLWNGKAAQELRKRMYEGDFSLCDRSACKMPLFTVEELSNNEIHFKETPISAENLEAIKRKDPVMPAPPSSLHLTADLTCNLSCASCRSKVIPNSVPTKRAQEEYDYVKKLKSSLEIVKMSSGGEVFYSTLQRQIIKNFNAKDFPKLKIINIVSNGTLFNQKSYDELAPGTSFIKDVSISLDAGSKEVYEKIRGPYWDQVYKNLKWISKMRSEGKFEFFSINFILQKENFRDIPNLIKLGRELDVDRILIQRYLDFLEQGYDTPEKRIEQSVHDPKHPDFQEVLAILNQFKDEPKLYTLLDIEGFEDKITGDAMAKKAWQLYQNANDFFVQGDFKKAKEIIKESIAIDPRDFNKNLLAKIYAELSLIELYKKNYLSAKNLLKEAYRAELKPYLESPSDITIYVQDKAYLASKKEDVYFSLDIFLILAELDSLDSQAWYTISTLQKSIGKNEEELISLKKALLFDPNNYFVLMQLGQIEKAAKNFQKALEYFEKAAPFEKIEQYGEAQRARYYALRELAQMQRDQGNLIKSLELFRQAKELGVPAKKEAVKQYENVERARYDTLRELAQIQRDQGNLEKSLELFNQTLEENPNEDREYILKSQYYILKKLAVEEKTNGNIEAALHYFREASKLKPEDEDEDSYLATSQYYILKQLALDEKEKGNIKQALIYFQEANEMKPVEDDDYIIQAQYYILLDLAFQESNLGSFESAIDYLMQALPYEPREKSGEARKYYLQMSFYMFRQKGFEFQQQGKYSEAIKVFNQALSSGEGDSDLFFSLAISLKRTKNFSEAEKYFLKILENHPENYLAKLELGFLEFRKNNRETALKYFLEAQSVEPESRKGFSDKYVRLSQRSSEFFQRLR